MSIRYLGEQFDIHAGGIDHIPIHHTNEIAQSEAATGKHPWVHYWVHNEFLVLDKGKMSKSAGGFLTLQSLADSGYDPLDYRYFLLGGHYRSQLQFSYEGLDSARNARRSLLDKVRALVAKAGAGTVRAALEAQNRAEPALSGGAQAYLAAFDRALNDDLSTPRALAELWRVLRDGGLESGEALAVIFDMDRVLGLGLQEQAKKSIEQAEDADTVKEIEELIARRAGAKKAKDFARADAIRDTLKSRGILLEDGPAGTIWRRL
jgi:cysteinyl-tRNA synthetase